MRWTALPLAACCLAWRAAGFAVPPPPVARRRPAASSLVRRRAAAADETTELAQLRAELSDMRARLAAAAAEDAAAVPEGRFEEFSRSVFSKPQLFGEASWAWLGDGVDVDQRQAVRLSLDALWLSWEKAEAERAQLVSSGEYEDALLLTMRQLVDEELQREAAGEPPVPPFLVAGNAKTYAAKVLEADAAGSGKRAIKWPDRQDCEDRWMASKCVQAWGASGWKLGVRKIIRDTVSDMTAYGQAESAEAAMATLSEELGLGKDASEEEIISKLTQATVVIVAGVALVVGFGLASVLGSFSEGVAEVATSAQTSTSLGGDGFAVLQSLGEAVVR